MFILDGDKAEAPESVPGNGGVGGKDRVEGSPIFDEMGGSLIFSYGLY